MLSKHLLALPFDQYSRHKLAAEAVAALARPGQQLKILEAGGRNGFTHEFLPDHQVMVLDIREPETPYDIQLKAKNQYLVGDVLNIPLPDQAVDICISMEMLEHLRPEQRPVAIQEMLRVSKVGAIVGFPFDSPDNDHAERALNAHFERLTGTPHLWLNEHLANRPLPQVSEVEKILTASGTSFVRLASNNTQLWTLMQYLVFTNYKFPSNLTPIFEFYNSHLKELGDGLPPFYRSVYVAVKPKFASALRGLQVPVEQDQEVVSAERLQLLDQLFALIAQQLADKDQHIGNIEQTVQAKEEAMEQLDKQLSLKTNHIQNLEKSVNAQNIGIQDLRQQIDLKQTHIQNLELSNTAQEAELKDKQQQIDLKQTHIQNLEQLNAAQVAELKVKEVALKDIRTVVQTLEEAVKQATTQITNQEAELRKTQAVVQTLEEVVAGQEAELSELDEKLKTREKLVQQLDQTIQDKDRHINNIQPWYDEMKSFRQFWILRVLFAGLHTAGRAALSLRHRASHLGVAFHILRTQGPHEVLRSSLRYAKGTSVAQNPLPASALPLNQQYKLLREAQLLTKPLLKIQAAQAKALPLKPRISIVVPVYYVDAKWVDWCLQSVIKQTYTTWELILAVHPAVEESTMQLVHKAAKKNPNIHLVTPSQVAGIVELLNTGVAAATGEFVTFLTADDELAPNGLFACVQALQASPQPDVLYSDQDEIQLDGDLLNPQFKTDLNPDLLLSTYYWGNLLMVRRSLGQTLGWFRPSLAGAHEYDLALRLLDATQRIHHIPQVLYHQRVNTNSLANDFEQRSFADRKSISALEDYAQRHHLKAQVTAGPTPGTFRFKRTINQDKLVSIIIPFKDKVDLLKKCVPGLLNHTDYKNFEILLVSNNSQLKETAQYVKDLVKLDPRVRAFEYNVPFNYSQINNWAAKQARGEYLLLLNNDIEVITPEWLSAMVEHIQRPEVGAVGAELLYPTDTIQHAGVILGVGGAAGHAHKYFPADQAGYCGRLGVIQNFSAVTGACLLTKKSIFTQVNGLNEKDLGVAFNDIDYCLKVRALGYLITYTPYAKLYHHESISRGYEDNPAKQARLAKELAYFLKTWGEGLQHDPYYNPNLTLKAENFGLNVF